MYVARGMEGVYPKCIQERTEGEGYGGSCVRRHLNTISFHGFVLWCLVLFVEI